MIDLENRVRKKRAMENLKKHMSGLSAAHGDGSKSVLLKHQTSTFASASLWHVCYDNMLMSLFQVIGVIILKSFGTDSGLHPDIQFQAHPRNISKSVYSRVKSPKAIPNTA